MKTILLLLLFILPAFGDGVTFLYDPNTKLTVVTTQICNQAIPNWVGGETNGDGSSTFIEAPYLGVYPCTNHRQYEGRFDVANFIINGINFKINKFLAYQWIYSLNNYNK